jgi:hypothetical protein
MKNTLCRYFLLIVTILTFCSLAYSQVCQTSATGGICGPYNYTEVTGNDANNINVQNACWNTSGYCNGSDQTLYATSPGNWYAVANFPSGNSSVQSYPNSDYYHVNTLVTSYSSMYSSFTENMGTIPSGSSAEAGFDIINMTNTGTSWNEVMIWNDVNNRGFGGCDSWPPKAQVKFGGSYGVPVNTWDLWSCGTSELIWQLDAGSSPPTHYGFQSGSVDIYAMMMWLVNNGYLGRGTTFGQIEYGFEICSTGGVNQTFTVSDWTLTSGTGAPTSPGAPGAGRSEHKH